MTLKRKNNLLLLFFSEGECQEACLLWYVIFDDKIIV